MIDTGATTVDMIARAPLNVQPELMIKTGKLVVNPDLTENAHCSRSLNDRAGEHKESSRNVDC